MTSYRNPLAFTVSPSEECTQAYQFKGFVSQEKHLQYAFQPLPPSPLTLMAKDSWCPAPLEISYPERRGQTGERPPPDCFLWPGPPHQSHQSKARQGVASRVTHETTDLLHNLNLKKAIAWLWDDERRRIVWASDAAVIFWHEDTFLDLLDRLFGPDDPMVKTLNRLSRSLPESGWHTQRLRFTPDAQTVWTQGRLKHHPISNGRQGLLIEIEAIDEANQTSLLPLDGVLGQAAPTPLALYSVDGQPLAQNDAHKDLFFPDEPADLPSRLEKPELAGKIILRVLAEGLYSRSVTLRTKFGPRFFRLTAKRAAHPQTGAPALVVHFQDIHDSRQTWKDMTRALKGLKTISGELIDVADAPQAPSSTAAAKGELTTFLDAFPQGIISMNEEGDITHVNRAARHLLTKFDMPKAEYDTARSMIGKPFAELFDSDLRTKILSRLMDSPDREVADRIISKGEHAFANELDCGGGLMLGLGAIWQNDHLRFFATLRDATEEQKIATVLKRERDQARARNNQKSDFIATLSHEMRTPLNAIIGFSQVMSQEHMGPMGNERYKEYVADIHASSAFLLSLVNDLLDMSKIEAGQFNVDQEDVDLKAIIDDCAALVRPLANKGKIAIHTNVDGHLPHIVADQRSVRQILLNLISNAIKFSHAGNDVYVAATSNQNGTINLSVRDTGMGMTQDELKMALEPFKQTPSAARAQANNPMAKGTGLGLPLAKALTEANKALFNITSVPEQGTKVIITFPNTLVLAE